MKTPDNAPRIWSVEDKIYLDCDHLVTFPNTPAGLRSVLKLLSNRTPTSRIGEGGDLTQHQINLDLSKAKAIKQITITPECRQTARDILRRLGIG